MKRYPITAGTFRLDDGSVKGVGDTIDLEDDVAAMHPEKLGIGEELPPPVPVGHDE